MDNNTFFILFAVVICVSCCVHRGFEAWENRRKTK